MAQKLISKANKQRGDGQEGGERSRIGQQFMGNDP